MCVCVLLVKGVDTHMHAHSLYEDNLIFCLTRLTTELSYSYLVRAQTHKHTHASTMCVECVGPVAATRAHIDREQKKRNQKILNAK